MCDTVVRLESFVGSDTEKNPAFKEYHGEQTNGTARAFIEVRWKAAQPVMFTREAWGAES